MLFFAILFLGGLPVVALPLVALPLVALSLAALSLAALSLAASWLPVRRSSRTVRRLSFFFVWGMVFLPWTDPTRVACAESLKRYEYEQPQLGTIIKLVFYASDGTAANRASQAAFARIVQLDGVLSNYKPESELQRLCRACGKQPATATGSQEGTSEDETESILADGEAAARTQNGAGGRPPVRVGVSEDLCARAFSRPILERP